MRVTYRGVEPQHIDMTFTLTKTAPPDTVFHSSDVGCLVVRTSRNKAIGVEYGAVLKVLHDVLPYSADMRRDLQAMLDTCEPPDAQTT